MSTKLAAAFFERVQRSGLVSDDRLLQLQQDLETQDVDVETPGALAKELIRRNVLTEWQADKLLQGKHKGFFIGSYRLLRPLGKGGMGAVFLAQHEMMRRQCAIKILPQTQIEKHSSVLDRFYVEAQAVASLDHQNIVRAYDVNKEVKDSKEIHYLVMEYVEGQDTQSMVQENGALDFVKAAEITRQTANGLQHAHENGLIHRDIKPGNIIIDKKGVVKILDLGLARFFDDSQTASLTVAHNETVLGTADYLSPEQALDSHTVDHRSDIYSLGCTAYFLLTGHPPFPDGTVAQRLVAHQVKQPKPISVERPNAPPELLAIIDRMMAKKPEERFQHAGDAAAALAAWLIKNGGEEWRRQHSEITADSSILRLLAAAARGEPTRAISSSMTDTELELAPLDEDQASEKPAPVAPTPGRKSGIAAGRAREHDELGLATIEEEKPAPEPAKEKTPAPKPEVKKKPAQKPSPPAVELPALAELPSGGAGMQDLLGDLPPMEPLGSLADLDQVAMSGPAGTSDVLGSLDKDFAQPVRKPISTAKRKPEPPKPKTLWENITSVGLPIIVGVGGGLLFVIIILLVYYFSSGDSPPGPSSRVTPPGASPGPSASEPPQQPAEPSTVVAQAPAAQPAPTETTPAPAEPPKEPIPTTPEVKPTEPPAAQVKPTEEPVEKPQVITPAPEPKKETPVVQAGKPAEPAVSEPPKAEAKAGGSKPETPDGPQPKPAAPASQKFWMDMFAEVKEISIDVKAVGVKEGQKTQGQAQGQPPIVGEITKKFTFALTDLGLQVAKTDKAVLRVEVTARLDEMGFNIVSLAGKLDCREGNAAPITVWSHNDDLTKFHPKNVPPNLDSLWRTDVADFVGQFTRDYKKAVNTVNESRRKG